MSALGLCVVQPTCLAQGVLSEEVPKGWEVRDTEITSRFPECRHYEYALQCQDTGDRFFLGRLLWFKERNPYRQDFGLNRNSIGFQWLEDHALLLVRWTTCAQGQGTNTMQTHLVLARVDRRWRQVYRHTQEEYARDYRLIRCKYSYDQRTKVLTIHEEDASSALRAGSAIWHGGSVPQTPLRGGDVVYLNEWRLRLDSGRLVYLGGTKSLDLDKREFYVWNPEKETKSARVYSLTEVARFLAHGKEQDERARLRKLNPQLSDKDMCSGVIVIDDSPQWRGTDERLYYQMGSAGEPHGF